MTGVQSAKREIAVGVMNLLVDKKSLIGYRQLRPMKTHLIDSVDGLLAAINAGGFAWDCSESTVCVFHVAGLADPTGQGYDGSGNTGSMLTNARLKRFTGAHNAHQCSLAVFNADKPLVEQHVAICHTADPLGGNPIMFTMGSPADPSLVLFKNLQPGFKGETVWLSVLGL